jgi:hypothetical protein
MIKTGVWALVASTALAGSPVVASQEVVVNGQAVPEREVRGLESMYRVRVLSGHYWYDRLTGAWGYWGGPTAGFILPGLALGGPLAANASNGTTGVFVNGRQLHTVDVLALMQITRVLRGRYWMDAYGNFGYERGPILGNIWFMANATGGRARREGILSTYDKTGAVVIGGR